MTRSNLTQTEGDANPHGLVLAEHDRQTGLTNPKDRLLTRSYAAFCGHVEVSPNNPPRLEYFV